MDYPSSAVHVELDDLLSLRGYVRRMKRRAQRQPVANLIQKKHGRGLEFAGLRAYSAGDEARHIDWRVFARSGEVHTRQFYPESTHFASISVDRALSMQFGSQYQSKCVLGHRLAAALAWYLDESGSRTQLLEDQPKVLAHAMAKWIEDPEPHWLLNTRLGDHYIFSDFSANSIEQVLAAQTHGATQRWVWLSDPLEYEVKVSALPFRLSKRGASTGWISGKNARETYANRRDRLRTLCLSHGIVLCEVSTDDPLNHALQKVLIDA